MPRLRPWALLAWPLCARGEAVAAAAATAADAAVEEPWEFKVLVAGLPRTGTETMHKALTILGYKSFHSTMQGLYNTTEFGTAWSNWAFGYNSSFEGPLETFRKERFTAASDVPFIFAWKEILEHFPKAKLILTLRDNPAQWYASVNKLYRHCHRWFLPSMDACSGHCQLLTLLLVPTWLKLHMFLLTATFPLNLNLLWHCPPTALQTWDVRQRCLRTYRDHTNIMVATAPPERLLLMNVRDGWAPLCRFLGVPVPSEPFPWGRHAEDHGEGRLGAGPPRWTWEHEDFAAKAIWALDFSLFLLLLLWSSDLARWCLGCALRRGAATGRPRLSCPLRSPLALSVLAVPVAAACLAARDLARSGSFAALLWDSVRAHAIHAELSKKSLAYVGLA